MAFSNSFDATKVTDNLYIGSLFACDKQQVLQQLGIRYIVNATTHIQNYFPETITYHRVSIEDSEDTDIMEHFDECSKFIANAIKVNKSSVLVHCKAGMSRSATLVIAYLMKFEGYDLKTAHKHLLRCRPIISPNKYFLAQLCQHELYLLRRNSMSVRDFMSDESKLKLKLSSSSTLLEFNPNIHTDSNQETVRMQIRFSRGNTGKYNIKMNKTDTIADLRNMIESSCSGVTSSVYQLVVTHPRQILHNQKMTIEKLDNCILTVNFLM
ncbi:protein phosphatase Slingshot [Acrasis kona]|uniref:protein-serine/threonine phosphatase n=1 Tax=Acrasis kona TaxID=1008807 RepID=A0AAW2ZK20_9EUKA